MLLSTLLGNLKKTNTVADPGFPRRGEGCQPEGGGTNLAPPLDPPMQQITQTFTIFPKRTKSAHQSVSQSQVHT